MVTQPLMYKKIAQHGGTRKLYADRLIAEGVITPEEPEAMIATYRAAMDRGQNTNKTIIANYKPPFTIDWTPYKNRHWTEAAVTAVPVKKLRALSQQLTTIPAGFKLHSRVKRSSRTAGRWARGECHWTGAWARRSPMQRCSTKGTGCAFPAKTSAAARFASARGAA
jgi:2-oxoglutarate dehydrogenase E1 component